MALELGHCGKLRRWNLGNAESYSAGTWALRKVMALELGQCGKL